ncbi:hypothetical protein C8J56DRAFT_335575 [Mycena floridula]|nr:hypothetical protein C8J56DRAFT_335575 [Mycena floridula]
MTTLLKTCSSKKTWLESPWSGDGRTKPHWSSASHSVGLKPSVARKSQAGELAGQKPKERTKWQPSSVEPPSTPLLPSKVKVHLDYVAPRFGDPDYEVLGKLGLTSFAGEICERKIIEFYEEACEATIRFHRRLPSLSRAKAPEVQERFDQGMKELADRKRREWKEMIELELKRRILEQRMTDTSHLRAAAKMKPFIPRETPGLVRTGATKKQLNRSASLPPGYHKAKEEHSKSFMDRFKKHVKFTQAAESDSDSTSDDDIPPPTPIAFRTSMSDADTGPTISFTHPDSPLLRDPKGKRRARIFF